MLSRHWSASHHWTMRSRRDNLRQIAMFVVFIFQRRFTDPPRPQISMFLKKTSLHVPLMATYKHFWRTQNFIRIGFGLLKKNILPTEQYIHFNSVLLCFSVSNFPALCHAVDDQFVESAFPLTSWARMLLL